MGLPGLVAIEPRLTCIDCYTAGALLDFKMNDKCAVGAVRFFEAPDSLLDTPEVEFDALAGS